MINKSKARKKTIIESLKSSLLLNNHNFPLPDLSAMGISAESDQAQLMSQFEKSLLSVGGEFIKVPDLKTAEAEIKKIYERAGIRIASMVNDINLSTFDAKAVTDPHLLHGLDLAILPGRFAVAENGAIWVDESDFSHRALIAIAESLVIVFKAHDLVPTMHQAYAKITFSGPGLGVFISGPSKTADIEQSLVIGAQGARSMIAFVIG